MTAFDTLGPREQRNDAGLLAFIVRDLMDAAGYRYAPGGPLAEQALECGDLIKEQADQALAAARDRKQLTEKHLAEKQRLTDLVNELRKQLAGADRHAAQLQDRVQDEHREAMRAIGALEAVRRERDDALTRLEMACPCLPDAPTHEHLAGGHTLTKDTPA